MTSAPPAGARLGVHLNSRTAPLAAALILGQREDIDPEINDAFARTGTTHLLAISGLQLQALALFLNQLFLFARVPRRLAAIGVALATLGYAVLVGFAASVVRSAVMTLAFCLAALVSRPTRPANTLALAGLATLAWNPFFLFDVGCQLSFLAIAALIWLVPRAQRGVRDLAGSIAQAVRRTPPPIAELKRRFEPSMAATFAVGGRRNRSGGHRLGRRLAGCPSARGTEVPSRLADRGASEHPADSLDLARPPSGSLRAWPRPALDSAGFLAHLGL